MPNREISLIKLLTNAVEEEICSGKFEPIRISAEGEMGKLIETINKLLSVFQTKNIEAEKRLTSNLFTLYELNYAVKMISFSLELNKLLDIAIDMVVEIARVEKGSIMLIDPENQELVVKVIKENGSFSHPEMRLRELNRILIEVIKESKLYLSTDDHSLEELGDGLGQGVTSILSLPLMGKEKLLGAVNLYNRLDGKEFTQDDINIISTLVSHIGISIENAQLFAGIKELFLSTVKALSSAIDAKDPYTYGHSERVTQYSLEIARRLGLNSQAQEEIQLAALLHDIGKIGIPDEVLHKPDKLSDDEFATIKTHPFQGSKIMEHVKQLSDIIPGMKHHHERFAGGGYPDGLKGEEVPLAGRIISVADAFDAMTSNRAYRQGMSTQKALLKIKEASGTQFDPKIVDVFIESQGGLE